MTAPGAALLVGTAGWSLPVALQPRFPGAGTHLERYARVLGAVEINSSFYRPHRPATYARWAAGVPDGFRFAVKVPRAITHERRLRDCGAPLAEFLDQARALGPALGCLLVQLPPTLRFEEPVAGAFLDALRALHEGAVALEPRHATWFGGAAERLMRDHGVARVAADPAVVPAAGEPGGAGEVAYFRLHGSPRIYHSPYDEASLDALAARIREAARSARAVWCIFDNTASGHALPDALSLVRRLAAAGA